MHCPCHLTAVTMSIYCWQLLYYYRKKVPSTRCHHAGGNINQRGAQLIYHVQLDMDTTYHSHPNTDTINFPCSLKYGYNVPCSHKYEYNLPCSPSHLLSGLASSCPAQKHWIHFTARGRDLMRKATLSLNTTAAYRIHVTFPETAGQAVVITIALVAIKPLLHGIILSDSCPSPIFRLTTFTSSNSDCRVNNKQAGRRPTDRQASVLTENTGRRTD